MSSAIKNILALLVIAAVIYGTYRLLFANSGTDLAVDASASEGELLASEFLMRLNEIQSISFSRDFFEDARFRSFVSFGSTPEPVAAGRSNPFSQ